MRRSLNPLLLNGLLLVAALSLATPIASSHTVAQSSQSLQDAQPFFSMTPEARPQPDLERIPPPETIPEPRRPHFRFDPQENSIGVVFTIGLDEMVHLWIPLGRKLYTRDSPTLPLHPSTARVTTMIRTSPLLAFPEQLDRIQCDLWTHSNRTRGRGKGRPEKWRVSFSKKDGLVRFADERASGRFWLGGKEVESYKCS